MFDDHVKVLCDRWIRSLLCKLRQKAVRQKEVCEANFDSARCDSDRKRRKAVRLIL